LFSLSNPDIDWVKLAAAMGVEGRRVHTFEALADVFHSAARPRGPFLIEFVIA
jgi:acetolactate synthase-1/2/3 large subunit